MKIDVNRINRNRSLNTEQKIGKYTLMSSTLMKMNDSIKNTERTGIEHAFSLCVDNNNKIHPGKEHKSTLENSQIVVFHADCKNKNQVPKGTYHTHITTKSTEPSALDLHSFCSEHNDIGCIGSSVDNKITCSIKKSERIDCQDSSVMSMVAEENKLIDNNEGNANDIYSKVDKTMRKYFDTKEIRNE